MQPRLTALAALAVLEAACSDADPIHPSDAEDTNAGTTNACELAAARLAECGVASSGLPDCDPTSQQDVCQADCLTEASCEELTALERHPNDTSLAVLRCAISCVDPSLLFDCADGSETILALWVCDGELDCADGSDEADCDSPSDWFDCADGTDTVPASWVCDGARDCLDGSDEENC